MESIQVQNMPKTNFDCFFFPFTLKSKPKPHHTLILHSAYRLHLQVIGTLKYTSEEGGYQL